MNDLFSIGSKVLIGDSIDAVVSAVMIRVEQQVQYECIYWDDNERKVEWVYSFEVKPSEDSKTGSFGFRK